MHPYGGFLHILYCILPCHFLVLVNAQVVLNDIMKRVLNQFTNFDQQLEIGVTLAPTPVACKLYYKCQTRSA